MSINEHDDRKLRCRMLGHEVAFAYCRAPGTNLPCRKILDCWFETFDVQSFLREHFSQEQIAQILTPPAPKIASLVDLIQQAQNRAKQNDVE